MENIPSIKPTESQQQKRSPDQPNYDKNVQIVLQKKLNLLKKSKSFWRENQVRIIEQKITKCSIALQSVGGADGLINHKKSSDSSHKLQS